MPSYEYRCESCRKEFVIRMTLRERDRARVKCPKCGSAKVARQLSGFFAKTSKKS